MPSKSMLPTWSLTTALTLAGIVAAMLATNTTSLSLPSTQGHLRAQASKYKGRRGADVMRGQSGACLTCPSARRRGCEEPTSHVRIPSPQSCQTTRIARARRLSHVFLGAGWVCVQKLRNNTADMDQRHTYLVCAQAVHAVARSRMEPCNRGRCELAVVEVGLPKSSCHILEGNSKCGASATPASRRNRWRKNGGWLEPRTCEIPHRPACSITIPVRRRRFALPAK